MGQSAHPVPAGWYFAPVAGIGQNGQRHFENGKVSLIFVDKPLFLCYFKYKVNKMKRTNRQTTAYAYAYMLMYHYAWAFRRCVHRRMCGV